MENDKVIVFSRKTLEERPIFNLIKDCEKRVILFTVKSAVNNCENLYSKFYKVEVLDDYYSWGVEKKAIDYCKKYQIDKIVSSSEDDVIRTARLRERIGVEGQWLESAIAFRDKFVMKEICKENGIKVPTYSNIVDVIDLFKFIDKYNYPIVVKPRLGAGSIGVNVINSKNELEKFLESGCLSAMPSKTNYWMVEKYVDGDFFHVDGIMKDGKVIHCWPSKYSSGNFEATKNSKILSTVLLSKDNLLFDDVINFTKKIIRCFPATPCPTSFHLELWSTKSGLVFCEIASRTGGGTIVHDYYNAFGVNLSEESIRGQSGEQLELNNQPTNPIRYSGSIMIPPKEGFFVYPSHQYISRDVTINYKVDMNKKYEKSACAGESIATVEISGVSAECVEKHIVDVVNWWEGENHWIKK